MSLYCGRRFVPVANLLKSPNRVDCGLVVSTVDVGKHADPVHLLEKLWVGSHGNGASLS
jgi:hypothetical protein